MWAWRSFLRRPNPLIITSCFQSVRRHDATHAALPCRNLTASSRRHISGAAINGDSHAEEAPTSATSNRLGSDQDRQLGRTPDQQNQRAAAAAKRHLYLVLDDHKHEYGIYKLDVDADVDVDDDDDIGSDSARLLPHPAIIRVEVPMAVERLAARFAALGSCIVTVGSSPNEFGLRPQHCGVTYVYDTETTALSVACDVPEGLHGGYHHDAVAIAGRLYAFETDTEGTGGMHCMSTDGRREEGCRWSWLPFSGSSRCFWSADPLPPPFYGNAITGDAVHPSGSAFFVSASEGWRGDVRTYSYDTTSGQWVSEAGWRWELPFVGHGSYDRELDAWVGLHADEDRLYETNGHLCACRVPLPSSDHRPPDWAVGGETMLLQHPDWRHVDAKLVQLGERSEYCLVERLRREGTNEKERLPDGDECLLRLTRFRLKCGDHGELVTTMDRRHARSYRVSRYRNDFEVQAFWI